jgi:gamma-glutamyltranspeptidase
MAFRAQEIWLRKLTWSELIEPARKLAVDGFVVTHRTEKRLEDYQAISRFADSRRIFLREEAYREERLAAAGIGRHA